MIDAGAASALEGYFQHGYGARHKALAGAGAADGRDATISALNPAGLIHAQNEADLAVGIFSPTREVTGWGAPGFTPMGNLESDTPYFFVPNSALSYHLASNPYVDVIGLSIYGNGANTDYPAVARPLLECGGAAGMYCGGAAGVVLEQYFLTLAAAKEIVPGFSVGVAPIVGFQQFRAKGLSVFAPTPDTFDGAWGYGVRGGLEWSITSDLRVGGSITSPTYMGGFSKYANLLAQRANCDVPWHGQAGVAYDAAPALTLMLDYQYIAFGSVRCVANPATNLLTAPFGAEDGAGFGWRDISAVKLGVEWRHPDGFTLRGGYSYNTPLFGARDVQLNILAPAATQHHITGGGELRLDQDWSLEFAAMFAPRASVSGPEITPGPAHMLEVATRQWEVMLGIKYVFDTKPAH